MGVVSVSPFCSSAALLWLAPQLHCTDTCARLLCLRLLCLRLRVLPLLLLLLSQERPDNMPVGLVPGVLKRAVGRALGYVSTRSQWLIGRVSRTRLVANRWPGIMRLHGTGL
jgi:hypothetical protein